MKQRKVQQPRKTDVGLEQDGGSGGGGDSGPDSGYLTRKTAHKISAVKMRGVGRQSEDHLSLAQKTGRKEYHYLQVEILPVEKVEGEDGS